MKTKTITLYEFHELPKATQKIALDKYREWNVNNWNANDWATEIIETAKENLKTLGYNNAEIFFSGFGSQGDGACYTSDDVHLLKIAQRLTKLEPEAFTKKYGAFENAYNTGEISPSIVHYGKYYHERSTTLDILYSGMNDIVEGQIAEITRLTEDEIVTLSKKLYKDLEAEYNDLTSDEAIKEMFELNTYHFNEKGEMVNE